MNFHARNVHQYNIDIRRILAGCKIVDHLDVIGASPVGAVDDIFILDLTPGFNGLGKCICKTRRKYLNPRI